VGASGVELNAAPPADRVVVSLRPSAHVARNDCAASPTAPAVTRDRRFGAAIPASGDAHIMSAA